MIGRRSGAKLPHGSRLARVSGGPSPAEGCARRSATENKERGGGRVNDRDGSAPDIRGTGAQALALAARRTAEAGACELHHLGIPWSASRGRGAQRCYVGCDACVTSQWPARPTRRHGAQRRTSYTSATAAARGPNWTYRSLRRRAAGCDGVVLPWRCIGVGTCKCHAIPRCTGVVMALSSRGVALALVRARVTQPRAGPPTHCRRC